MGAWGAITVLELVSRSFVTWHFGVLQSLSGVQLSVTPTHYSAPGHRYCFCSHIKHLELVVERVFCMS